MYQNIPFKKNYPQNAVLFETNAVRLYSLNSYFFLLLITLFYCFSMCTFYFRFLFLELIPPFDHSVYVPLYAGSVNFIEYTSKIGRVY